MFHFVLFCLPITRKWYHPVRPLKAHYWNQLHQNCHLPFCSTNRHPRKQWGRYFKMGKIEQKIHHKVTWWQFQWKMQLCLFWGMCVHDGQKPVGDRETEGLPLAVKIGGNSDKIKKKTVLRFPPRPTSSETGTARKCAKVNSCKILGMLLEVNCIHVKIL